MESMHRYEFKMIVDGQEKVMNGSECRALRYHDDQKVRRQAMQLFLILISLMNILWFIYLIQLLRIIT